MHSGELKMFWIQLKQLMWKNFLTRKRSKIRVTVELLWPLVLFVILALVRTKGLKEYKNECFFQEKALPSAGSLKFLQSLICTFQNQCSDSPNLPAEILIEEHGFNEYTYDNFHLRNKDASATIICSLRNLIQDLRDILASKITEQEIDKISGASSDVVAAVAFALKVLNSGSQPKLSISLQDILNEKELQKLIILKYGKQPISLASLFNASIGIPPSNSLRSQLENPKRVVCNATLLKMWIDIPDEPLEVISQVLCQSSSVEILRVFNSSSLINKIRAILEETLQQPLHPDSWNNVGRLSLSIVSDITNLDSLSRVFRTFRNTTFGKIANSLWEHKEYKVNNASSAAMLISSTFTAICGGNASIKERQGSDEFPDASQNDAFRQKFFKNRKDKIVFHDPSPVCAQLFTSLQQNLYTRLIFELFYPFIRGKIIYAPNTPAFSRVIREVNETFQDLREVQRFANMWLSEISPIIHKFLIQLNEETVRNITEIINNDFPVLRNLTSFLENATEQITSIKTMIVRIDFIAELVVTYVDCYEFDKFEGYATEAEAVNRGLTLMNDSKLWGVIIFHASSENDVEKLPRNVTYKLRMDSSKIDSTKRLRDFFELPSPRSGSKYYTSGFIYLQDKIEQAIIKVHSNRTRFPGMYMQPFPNPCYIYDTYFMAIAGLFPLFMILSFVYTCAMIVKSVVREKEQRLKETMKAMGLGNGVHWLAWFIDSISFLLISCVLLSMILVFGRVLENSDFLLVFVFILSFSVATICFSFLVSTLFSRANLAAACGGFAFFACFLPFQFFNLNSQDYSLSTMILSSLLSDVSFGIGCWYFATYEQSGIGAQWSNIATSPKEGDEYSLLGCILMMLLDSVLYLLLTWYIETVFPGQYGIPKPWYFMFQPSYWCSSSKFGNNPVDPLALSQNQSSNLLETESRELEVGVSIRNLGKKYSNGKVALHNLSINFYQDQITSFLGHNGAGKTTTISILTGLFPPTHGTVMIGGLDIGTHMDKIRQQLGVCPQHNILFDQLTVEEHLHFYAALKTGKHSGSSKEIDKMIEDLGLDHKRQNLSKHLSGGMKRKLSIGAAFIGNSKTVILDEPTAGVDPYSRRSIWDILLKFKQGRTIILTTHFMDEADLLGDRIAIIAQGQLKCCGSSLFLKQKLGSGYYLTIVTKNAEETPSESSALNRENQPIENLDRLEIAENQTRQLVNLVNRFIPNGKMVHNVGSDVVFCLPEFNETGICQREKFSDLFRELDSNMESLGVDSYGVSDTTLEEVFLKIVNDPSEEDTTPPVQAESTQVMSSELPMGIPMRKIGTRECLYEELPQVEYDANETFNLSQSEKLTGFSLVAQHFLALYTKRFCNSKRNLKGFICEIILPALFIIINQLTTMSLNAISAEPPIVLSPWLYGESNVAFYANENPFGGWSNSYVRNMVNESGMGFKCVNNELTSLTCSSNNTGLLNPTVNYTAYQDFRCPCSEGLAMCPANLTDAELPKYKSVTSDEFYDLSRRDISLWLIRTYKKFKKLRSGGFEFGLRDPLRNVNLTIFSKDMEELVQASRLSQGLFNVTARISEFERTSKIEGTFDFIKVWYDNKAWASSVSYLNAINNVILRSSIPKSKKPNLYSITAINHPMNFSTKDLQDRFRRQAGVSVLHAISVIFSMSFVPASFVLFLVEERVSKAKHLQFVSGVKPITFWVASFSWDIINYLIPGTLVILILVAFDQQAYIGPSSIQGMILLLVLYGFSSIPLMYPASLIFSVPSSAFVGLACGNLFIGVITTISAFVLQLFEDEQLKFIGAILNEVYLIFPHYCLGRGMIDMAQVYYRAKALEVIGGEFERNIYEWNYLGRYFLSLIIQSVVFFSFTLMLHYQMLPQCVVKRFQRTTMPPLEVEDEDVARERIRVEQDATDELRLIELTKMYRKGKEPATNRLSFGLKKGECFGLLGVNGAGKSTTFKMLTGDLSVTSGNAFVGGHSILSNLKEAQQNLGYCPQEDALLPLLTGSEHLRFFARLRGVPQRNIDTVVRESLKKLGLLPYKNRCAETYSGGNKRKLSTAIAFIGNPAVVFLDEPSSGMDPKARRSLWSAIIDAIKNSRSILLTSHSMEECQILCTRLAIMVNGTLRCLGSAQHLKNRFGSGYMITVRCEADSLSAVLQYMQSALPEARLREQRSRQLIWHVKSNVLSVSALFNRMESARVATNMVDYSITQTTLDDVFIRFARLQKGSDEENRPGHEIENLPEEP